MPYVIVVALTYVLFFPPYFTFVQLCESLYWGLKENQA